jgi:hypothetical protein
MAARRTFAHGGEGGWSAVALHLEPASADQEGFYLTLFPDGRPQAVVFLRGAQLEHILDLSADAAVSDQAIWDVVAKIPLEPLLPSRALSARLRALLTDFAGPLREQIRAQAERRPAPAPATPDPAGDGGDSDPTP